MEADTETDEVWVQGIPTLHPSGNNTAEGRRSKQDQAEGEMECDAGLTKPQTAPWRTPSKCPSELFCYRTELPGPS